MVDVLWKSFPKLLEENVNGLLDEAQPTALKAFQLYKSCEREGLWNESLENFSRHLENFYSRPREIRHKSDFDIVLSSPMPHHLYERFHLDFRTAAVNEDSLLGLASWAHNIIRVAKKTTAAFASLDVMTKTMKALVQVAPFARADRIEFEDFTTAWQKTVFRNCGTKDHSEFSNVLNELHWLHAENKKSDQRAIEIANRPVLLLSAVEIDWIQVVQKAALLQLDVPAAALQQGFSKSALKELERVVTLYSVSQSSRLPEIIANRAKIRATLLDRCETLLAGTQHKLAS